MIESGGEKKKEISPFQSNVINLAAGGVAGGLSRTIVSPLERLKILYQVQQKGDAPLEGIWSTLKRMGREEGWRGYLKGNGTNVVRIVPYSAVQFASFEIYKKFLLSLRDAKPGDSLVTWERLCSGAMAGITSVFSTYPLDLIRTRLSLPNHNYKGIIDCGRTLVRDEGGVLALFRGLNATTLGVAPYIGLNFAVYETLKENIFASNFYRELCLEQENMESEFTFDNDWSTQRAYHLLLARWPLPEMVRFCCGGMAGFVAQTITYPLDVLRRRMQVVGMKHNSSSKVPGMIFVMREMYFSQGGIRAFYRGLLPNYLKVVPSMSVSFVTYEWTRDLLESTIN